MVRKVRFFCTQKLSLQSRGSQLLHHVTGKILTRFFLYSLCLLFSEENKGTTFFFTVKLDPTTCALSHSMSSQHAATSPRRTTNCTSCPQIFIVDNNETQRRVLSDRLTKWGFRTVACQNVSELLRVFQVQPPPVTQSMALIDSKQGKIAKSPVSRFWSTLFFSLIDHFL